ncbi:MAG: peptide ABC transporter substrate-binding protein [Christensenellales bacterium]
MGKKATALVLLIILAFSLCACSAAPENGDNGQQSPSAPALPPVTSRGIAVTFIDGPAGFDPALCAMDRIQISYMMNLFEGLYKYDQDGKVVFAMAEELSISDDGKVLTFTIRSDARWSDGRAVTAADFVYAWRRAADPELKAPYRSLLLPILNASDVLEGRSEPDKLGIAAVDEKTLEVKLDEPEDSRNIQALFTYPIFAPLREDMKEGWAISPQALITNGPFHVAGISNHAMTYAASDTYYDFFDMINTQIEFKFYDGAEDAYQAFAAGDVLFSSDVPDAALSDYADFEQSPIVIQPQLGTYFIDFNNARAPFNDRRVRQAFSLVIPRGDIAGNVMKGLALPATGFVPNSVSDLEPGTNFRTTGGHLLSNAVAGDDEFTRNVTLAQKLLEDAGYEGGEDFPAIEYLYNKDSAQQEAIAQQLQLAWKEHLGVTVLLRALEAEAFLAARETGDYFIARDGVVTAADDPYDFLSLFLTGYCSNHANFFNKQYDNLLLQSVNTSSEAERLALLHQAEQILIGEAGVAPVYFYATGYLLNPALSGVVTTPQGFFLLQHIQLDESKVQLS